MWELDHKEKLSTEELIVLNCGAGVFLECPLESKEIKPVSPKGNQSWIFIGRTDAEAEAPILWPPDVNNWLIWKDPDAGKDWGFEEKGTMQDEMVGWHHRLDGHEFDQASGFDYGQESLAWCRVRRDWATELNLTVFYTIWFYFHHQTHLHLSVIFALAQSLHPFWSNLQLSSALPQQHIRHLPAWGTHLLVSYHFTFLYSSWGSHGTYAGVVCHSLLQWITFCQNFLLWPVHLVWPYMAWLIASLKYLSPINHDKAVFYEGVLFLPGSC